MTNHPNRNAKHTYTAWVKNSSGASESVTWRDGTDAEWTSYSEAAAYVRSRYGSGWHVVIEDEDGNTAKSFTIR